MAPSTMKRRGTSGIEAAGYQIVEESLDGGGVLGRALGDGQHVLRFLAKWRPRCEPLRVCRRLQLLRGWSYDKAELSEIFT